MCPGVNSASKKWVPGIPLGVKAAGAWGWRPTTLVVPNVKKSRALTYPDPLGPSQRPVVGETFTFTLLLLLLLLPLLLLLQLLLLLLLLSPPTCQYQLYPPRNTYKWSSWGLKCCVSMYFNCQCLRSDANCTVCNVMGSQYVNYSAAEAFEICQSQQQLSCRSMIKLHSESPLLCFSGFAGYDPRGHPGMDPLPLRTSSQHTGGELTETLTYFPAHRTHFFPEKMWPKFDLRLMRRG